MAYTVTPKTDEVRNALRKFIACLFQPPADTTGALYYSITASISAWRQMARNIGLEFIPPLALGHFQDADGVTPRDPDEAELVINIQAAALFSDDIELRLNIACLRYFDDYETSPPFVKSNGSGSGDTVLNITNWTKYNKHFAKYRNLVVRPNANMLRLLDAAPNQTLGASGESPTEDATSQ